MRLNINWDLRSYNMPAAFTHTGLDSPDVKIDTCNFSAISLKMVVSTEELDFVKFASTKKPSFPFDDTL